MRRSVHWALSSAAALCLLAAPIASGASADLVVSQVYAGGGNSGATYIDDFVELFNRGSSAVDLTGWSLQYATATGTSWQVTALAGSLAPGHHSLVALASGGAAGAPLPAVDQTGTSNLATSGGKVALVHDTAALTCGATVGSCGTVATVHDLVGYGSATDYEGSAAPALSNTTAAMRGASGCNDTDANDSDFTADLPSPRTTASVVTTCSGTVPTGSGSGSGAAQVDLDLQSSLSIALEKPTLSFGSVFPGASPAALTDRVTVTSTNAAGYSLSAHRSAFTPADLPLGLAASAPGGGQLASALAGNARVALPVAPATDLLVGTTSAPSAGTGDNWSTSLGFTSPLPSLAAGHYSATVTFTVIAR
ncbi:MAG TPA: lamin tail domain-containing protein [Gaiellaceae bacterium]